jgi:hypothetical protein
MCEHRWRKVNEQFLLGGSFPIGYRCVDCRLFIPNSELSPLGTGGTLLNEEELIGPHGGNSNCSDGSVYKRQIINNDSKTLTIERPDGTLEIRSLEGKG